VCLTCLVYAVVSTAFSCSICLDLLDIPVTIPCGHSYCMVCIKGFWKGKENDSRSCPQCRETFTSEPALVKNTMLAKHKLVEPFKNLQETICSIHNEVMKLFCRTDQKSICYLCSVEEHKGHDTVSAAAERTERQRELEEKKEVKLFWKAGGAIQTPHLHECLCGWGGGGGSELKGSLLLGNRCTTMQLSDITIVGKECEINGTFNLCFLVF
uniref:RING-type domain-containing protein n=1 Tax=Oryzias latipes TaxID=8090 RepID=A0A3P9IJN5_ORYLA